MQDESVIYLAAEEGVSFDVCPISNVKLKAVSSLEEHPILQLEKMGVLEELEKVGVRTGDTVRIGEVEMEWD